MHTISCNALSPTPVVSGNIPSPFLPSVSRIPSKFLYKQHTPFHPIVSSSSSTNQGTPQVAAVGTANHCTATPTKDEISFDSGILKLFSAIAKMLGSLTQKRPKLFWVGSKLFSAIAKMLGSLTQKRPKLFWVGSKIFFLP